MYANDPSIFVKNGGYHLKEGVEMNLLGPITGDKSDRRTVFKHHSTTTSYAPSTTANGGDLASKEFPPPHPTKLQHPLRLVDRRMSSLAHCWWSIASSPKEREREWFREREREGGSDWEREKETARQGRRGRKAAGAPSLEGETVQRRGSGNRKMGMWVLPMCTAPIRGFHFFLRVKFSFYPSKKPDFTSYVAWYALKNIKQKDGRQLLSFIVVWYTLEPRTRQKDGCHLWAWCQVIKVNVLEFEHTHVSFIHALHRLHD